MNRERSNQSHILLVEDEAIVAVREKWRLPGNVSSIVGIAYDVTEETERSEYKGLSVAGDESPD